MISLTNQKQIKRMLKGRLKSIRLAWFHYRHPFSADDLLNAIRRVGVQPGNVVFVHSSLNAFEGFIGKPMEINLILQKVVGAGGTLLMATLPFRGSAIEYVAQSRTFDVRTTPSQMGLLTELFRRAPGIVRSVHPTHPVAVWGAHAAEIVADHHRARTPCGQSSPFHRLLELDGKVLFLGTDISVMTFFHYLEEELEPKMAFSPFTKEVFSLRSKDWNGNELVTETRLYDPVYSRQRDLSKLVPVLKSQGAWRESSVGKVKITLLSANEIARACRKLAQQGVYCYDQ